MFESKFCQNRLPHRLRCGHFVLVKQSFDCRLLFRSKIAECFGNRSSSKNVMECTYQVVLIQRCDQLPIITYGQCTDACDLDLKKAWTAEAITSFMIQGIAVMNLLVKESTHK